jgi:hypothetical protein
MVFPVEAGLFSLYWAIDGAIRLHDPADSFGSGAWVLLWLLPISGVVGALATVCVTAPAVALGEAVVRRGRRWHGLIAAAAVGLVLAAAFAWVLRHVIFSVVDDIRWEIAVVVLLIAPAMALFLFVTHAGGAAPRRPRVVDPVAG